MTTLFLGFLNRSLSAAVLIFAVVLVRLVFKDSKTTSIPLIARLAAEENIFCNVISASTQKLSETVYGSMMLGIPSAQFDKAVAFIHNVANVQVEEVDSHVQ